MRNFKFILLFVSFFIYANDAIFYGSGTNVYPVEETSIVLESEIISFYQNTDYSFKVNANLILYNPLEKDLKVKLGFPDIGIENGESGKIILAFKENFDIPPIFGQI